MAKGPSGKKGNRATRYSRIGNTSWLRAKTLGIIDENGIQTNKRKRRL